MIKKFFWDRLIFILKYFIGIALLFWVILKVDRKKLIETFISINIESLLMVLLISALVIFLQFLRWQFLVNENSINYDKRDVLPAFFAGFAFRLMLPGGHAEITKIFLMPGKKSGKAMAFGMEKFLETYFKFLLVIAAIPFFFTEYKMLWYFTALGVATLFFLPYIFRSRLIKRFHEKESEHNKTVTITLLYSALVFVALSIEYYVLLNSVYSVSFFNTALSVTFIWGAGLIPISISGMGVRENIAIFLFSKYGIPDSAAVGYALLVFFLNMLLPAIIGFFFIYRKRAHLNDVKRTIKSAYHQNKETFKVWKKNKHSE